MKDRQACKVLVHAQTAYPLIPSFSVHANKNRHIVHDRAQQQEQGDSMGHEY